MATLTKRESDREVSQRLAANLVAMMKRYGLTQVELSDRSGVHQTSISNVILAKSCPSVSMVARLAEALGVSVDRLLRPSLTARAPRSRRAARVS